MNYNNHIDTHFKSNLSEFQKLYPTATLSDLQSFAMGWNKSKGYHVDVFIRNARLIPYEKALSKFKRQYKNMALSLGDIFSFEQGFNSGRKYLREPKFK